MSNELKTAEALSQMIMERAKVGLEKYGVTVDRTDLTFDQWSTHAIEEALDMAHYLQRAKEEFLANKGNSNGD